MLTQIQPRSRSTCGATTGVVLPTGLDPVQRRVPSLGTDAILAERVAMEVITGSMRGGSGRRWRQQP